MQDEVAVRLKRPIVGYIGLGDMGAPVAHRLLAAGHDLVVLNRTRSKMQPLIDAGAASADDPADIGARCDVVFLCLDTPQGVEDVTFGRRGLASSGRRVRWVVDNSTLHPSTAADLAARARTEGFAYLDAPVTGGSRGARAGTLVVMVGGEVEDVVAVRPLIMTFAKTLTHMGSAGAGMAAKICNQILLFSSMLATAEMMAVAQRVGLEPQRLLHALEGGAGDSVLLRSYARALASGRHESGTGLVDKIIETYKRPEGVAPRVGLGLKDVDIALDLGRVAEIAMPLMTRFRDVVGSL